MSQLITINGSNQQQIFAIIDKADLADTTKLQYRKAVANYLATGSSLTDAEALADYAATLPKSSRSFLKAAIKKWADAMMVAAKGQATPQNIDAIQATTHISVRGFTRIHFYWSAKRAKDSHLVVAKRSQTIDSVDRPSFLNWPTR